MEYRKPVKLVPLQMYYPYNNKSTMRLISRDEARLALKNFRSVTSVHDLCIKSFTRLYYQPAIRVSSFHQSHITGKPRVPRKLQPLNLKKTDIIEVWNTEENDLGDGYRVEENLRTDKELFLSGTKNVSFEGLDKEVLKKEIIDMEKLEGAEDYSVIEKSEEKEEEIIDSVGNIDEVKVKNDIALEKKEEIIDQKEGGGENKVDIVASEVEKVKIIEEINVNTDKPGLNKEEIEINSDTIEENKENFGNEKETNAGKRSRIPKVELNSSESLSWSTSKTSLTLESLRLDIKRFPNPILVPVDQLKYLMFNTKESLISLISKYLRIDTQPKWIFYKKKSMNSDKIQKISSKFPYIVQNNETTPCPASFDIELLPKRGPYSYYPKFHYNITVHLPKIIFKTDENEKISLVSLDSLKALLFKTPGFPEQIANDSFS